MARADAPIPVPRAVPAHALPSSLHPVAARVLAARGILDAADLGVELAHLLPPSGLLGIDAAAALIETAIREGRRIIVAGDYDADGATGVALGVLGLRALGARDVDYVVPHRVTMGYGLSPLLAEEAHRAGAQLLVTVDNGIASHAGVARAVELGVPVVVTDHHLSGATLPTAAAIVNPNQPGCGFPSKNLAGVGVLFYVLLAVRARLRDAGAPSPNLAELLDLVALGTVADLVRLDRNNRILVAQGLARMRAGRARPGIRALLKVAGKEAARLTTADLGFVLGPRINAAGRLDDIRVGIECLLCDDETHALDFARELDRINRDRRTITAQMSEEGLAQLAIGDAAAACGLCVFDETWHEGVVGLVASRLKERHHRPCVAFARAHEPGVLKGSARSIAGLHLRDALAAIDVATPGLVLRFGGHAMAAGLSLRESDLETFRAHFDAACRTQLSPAQLERRLETDGALAPDELVLATAHALEAPIPWGQGVPEPVFDNVFEVVGTRLVGAEEAHVQYRLRLPGGIEVRAVDFNGVERLVEGCARVLYTLGVNRWNGNESAELRIAWLEPAARAS
jgi:single-stranded-DNA-specific exonuclease